MAGGVVSLAEGGGGTEMQRLIGEIRKILPAADGWDNTLEDSASAELKRTDKKLCFTSDSYVVKPLFFPGGNIGKIAFCGTINDLAVMGSVPKGISLSLVIEEGFPKGDLFEIIRTIAELSRDTGVPVVTGDTKVMERGSVDGLIINTSGVGLAEEILDRPLHKGDKVIVSGSIGNHGAALLAARFDVESDIVTDSKPLLDEISAVRKKVLQAKDITRGGLSAVLNELAEKNKVEIIVQEEMVPIRKAASSIAGMLGLEPLVLACEGRFVCVARPEDSEDVVNVLKKFNPEASVIGEVRGVFEEFREIGRVFLKTRVGTRILPSPSGKLVPRIC